MGGMGTELVPSARASSRLAARSAQPRRGGGDLNSHNEGLTLWLTGLPRAGKSTVAGLVAGRLRALGVSRVEVLDGDVVREGLCRDLGFSRADRTENIRRIAFVSKLLTRNGVAVIVAAISPYREDRERAREEIQSFVEVWCRASVEVCAARDYKGLYEKAMRGEISDLTGVNDPYEEPEDADLVLDTENETPEQSADRVMELLHEKGHLPDGWDAGRRSG